MFRIAVFLIALVGSTFAWGKPNIIVILTDDQQEALTLRNDPATGLPLLPKLKSLMLDRGTRFTNSFVDFPLCCPSRVSLLTGQAAHNHGVKHNEAEHGGGWSFYEPQQLNSLPVWLKGADYKTAWVGKYLNEYNSDPSSPPGWDEWFAFYPRPGYYNYSITDNGTVGSYGSSEQDYSTDVLAAKAAEVITETPCYEPLFMVVAPFAPHRDQPGGSWYSTPPQRYAGDVPDLKIPPGQENLAFNEADVSDKPGWIQNLLRFGERNPDPRPEMHERNRQAVRSLRAVDDLLETVINALEQQGTLANTIICYTSDNGFFYGEHRIDFGKIFGYEPSLRVPLICRGPGIPEGQTRDHLVNNLDLTATILDWAGAEPGRVLDGKSFAPVIADEQTGWRSVMFFDGTFPNCQTEKCYSGVRTLTRKYTKWGDGFEELYDMTLDPIENENKASDPAYAADLTELRAKHETLKTCSGAGCW